MFALAAFLLVGCYGSTSDSIQADQETVNTQQSIYADGQPIPLFNYSQIRETLISIYEAKTSVVSTWSVVVDHGVPQFSCPSIGFPIPATQQLTSSTQIGRVDFGNGNRVSGVIDQAEPDGTYTGQTTATYVVCVRPDGEATPIYSESNILTFPFEVSVIDGRIVDGGGGASFSVGNE